MDDDINVFIGSLFFIIFGLSFVLTLTFLIRQIVLSLFVRFTKKKSIYSKYDLREWPNVTVIIPAHNEEAVIGDCIRAVSKADYPKHLLKVIIIDDRSTDRTGAIADCETASFPNFRVIHRHSNAAPGKPAAIKEICDQLETGIAVFFDADYTPNSNLIKQLVCPFVDPEVGATMGRVIPVNCERNTLTRLIDLERRGGYAVDQYARGLLNLLPQFGGTVGAIRVSALRAVGGWRDDILAEDTELTFRLYINGWTVEYLNHAVCYEESPETWQARYKQVRRWAYGHNDCLFRYGVTILKAPTLGFFQKIDAVMILLFFSFPLVSLIALVAAIIYPTLYEYPPLNFTLIPAFSFLLSFGYFSSYLQIITATIKDQSPRSSVFFPLLFLSSTISMLASVDAFLRLLVDRSFGRTFHWDKTQRFRQNKHVI